MAPRRLGEEWKAARLSEVKLWGDRVVLFRRAPRGGQEGAVRIPFHPRRTGEG